nr:imidazoleglycerol-phosphate dehydratase HisB [Desulfobulbaceae bacterium]
MPAASQRKSTIKRTTKETDIDLTLSIDGSGKADIATGVPFMDHMLTLFAVHGFFDLTVKASGDTAVDDHHTVEDLGICLGQAVKNSLNEYNSIKRYGEFSVPMDEALVRATMDLSNRPHLHYEVTIPEPKVGTFDTELVKEFLRAFSLHAGMTLHIDMIRGENSHHIIEATFKAVAKALDIATTIDTRVKGALSSKGTL